jgi:phosphatidylserine/phosphatidylglycerophosphate/cardiolipin synthase-like enzyme
LRRLYESIKQLPERHRLGGLAGSLSVCCDPTIQPVRCVGNHNREKKPAFPRMHNKFLVFCDVLESGGDLYSGFEVKPYTVWTGSFNLTKNAAMSLENALVLTDPNIVRAYFREWEQILALSEPLDWGSDWCEPEWRIGT